MSSGENMASGLEVVNSTLPQHYNPDIPKEAVQHSDSDSPFPSEEADNDSRDDEKADAGVGRPQKRSRYKSPLVVGFVAALVSAIIVGAAVGGGLGSKLNSAERRLNSAEHKLKSAEARAQQCATGTPTTNSSGFFLDYAAAAPSKIASLDFDCASAEKTYITSYEETFDISCVNTVSGDNTSRAGEYAGFIVAYTLDACIEAYSSMNYFSNSSGPCQHVEFLPAMAANLLGEYYSNCLLIGAKISWQTRPQTGPLAGGASANRVAVAST